MGKNDVQRFGSKPLGNSKRSNPPSQRSRNRRKVSLSRSGSQGSHSALPTERTRRRPSLHRMQGVQSEPTTFLERNARTPRQAFPAPKPSPTPSRSRSRSHRTPSNPTRSQSSSPQNRSTRTRRDTESLATLESLRRRQDERSCKECLCVICTFLAIFGCLALIIPLFSALGISFTPEDPASTSSSF